MPLVEFEFGKIPELKTVIPQKTTQRFQPCAAKSNGCDRNLGPRIGHVEYTPQLIVRGRDLVRVLALITVPPQLNFPVDLLASESPPALQRLHIVRNVLAPLALLFKCAHNVQHKVLSSLHTHLSEVLGSEFEAVLDVPNPAKPLVRRRGAPSCNVVIPSFDVGVGQKTGFAAFDLGQIIGPSVFCQAGGIKSLRM